MKMNKHSQYKIGDIVQTRLHNKSFCQILEIDGDILLVRYVKSKHGVPIRKGRIFKIHENWFRQYRWIKGKMKWELDEWIKPINREI